MTADDCKQMCVAQGYVPAACTLDGVVALAEVSNARDPCAGCNKDRAVCGGRPYKPLTIMPRRGAPRWVDRSLPPGTTVEQARAINNRKRTTP